MEETTVGIHCTHVPERWHHGISKNANIADLAVRDLDWNYTYTSSLKSLASFIEVPNDSQHQDKYYCGFGAHTSIWIIRVKQKIKQYIKSTF